MLNAAAIERLLTPYVESTRGDKPRIPVPADLYEQLKTYLDLLLRWNARTNLTAIREPEEIVRRHFGESLFLGLHLPVCHTLLDFGSGAGFPGLPVHLLHPALSVTLAESQGKKAAFLREAVRVLGLSTEVWAGRVASLPAHNLYDVVALRAVDRMEQALQEASLRAAGHLCVLGTAETSGSIPQSFQVDHTIALPDSATGRFLLASRA